MDKSQKSFAKTVGDQEIKSLAKTDAINFFKIVEYLVNRNDVGKY